MIETERWVTAPLQEFRRGRFVSGIFDLVIRGSHFLFVLNQESDMKKWRIGSVHRILAIHQNQDKTIRSIEDGESAVAPALRNFEVEAALEKIGERRNITDSEVNVIEFQHLIISITGIRAGRDSS